MDNFATRSALVAVWITIGALGLTLFVTGGVNIWGSFVVNEAVGNMMGASAAMGIIGFILLLVGGAITLFSGFRIYRDVTRPMTPGKNARAETPLLRSLAVVAFTMGTAVGGYGLYKLGMPMVKNVTDMITLESTTAKVISLDPIESDDGLKSGAFVYYAGNPQQKLRGEFKGKFKNLTIKPGYTFDITYNNKTPSDYYLDRRRPNPAYLVPDILGLLIVFWMVAAGITGIRANIGDDEDNPQNAYKGHGYDPNPHVPNFPSSGKQSFGKFRG